MSENILNHVKARFGQIVRDEGLAAESVSVRAKPLTPTEAIGEPTRSDYPIVAGRERLIEAQVAGSRGQAFTDTPRDFSGVLSDVLALPLDCNAHRAAFVATLNATLRHLGRIAKTVHCKDDEPERCAEEIAREITERYGAACRVGLVGLNPAIADKLIDAFGASCVRIVDLDPDKVGKVRAGVTIWDGASQVDALITFAELVLVTGTTLTNGTFDSLFDKLRASATRHVLYGVTAAGVAELAGSERLCPRAG